MEVSRGPLVESVHGGAIAVADRDGRVLASLGGIDEAIYLRSCAKPFQAMAVVESGAVERFGLSPRELAVMTGSHGSEPEQVAVVAGILEKIGLDRSALGCGTHTPFNREVADAYRRSGRPLTPLEHNCSGKHAGMLAAAVAGGHRPDSYLEPSHPVQRRILGVVADLTGRPPDRIVIGEDGCGAPTLGVSLAEAARAFARLVCPDRLPAEHQGAAARVVEAMRQHPEMIAGRGMLDTELTAHPRSTLISKRGAEGVQCAAFVDGADGCGIAAKIADGDNGRARVAVILDVLRQLEALTDQEVARLTEASALIVRNDRGREVGRVRAIFKLLP